MKDESCQDNSDVGCPSCESGSGCDHLLPFFFATDGRVDGGVVDPYDFDEIVERIEAEACLALGNVTADTAHR